MLYSFALSKPDMIGVPSKVQSYIEELEAIINKYQYPVRIAPKPKYFKTIEAAKIYPLHADFKYPIEMLGVNGKWVKIA